MFTQFFGNYLLNKGLVNASQLSDALAVQKQTRTKLGVLAINAGYMTAEQVDMVHAQQQKVDKRIGDIACDMGFLTPEKVDELLRSQGAAHLQLGQALVDAGAMTNSSFAEALSGYKAENSLTDVDFNDNSGEKLDGIIKKFYSFDGSENADMLCEYVTLLLKNVIRFIGDDFTPLTIESASSASLNFAASQKITGEFSCTTLIEAAETPYVMFASRYAEEELVEADEMTHASNGEFLNLHNGLFTVNISNEKNAELKLEPQEYCEDGSVSGTVYRIPLVFPFGTINFIIVI